MKALILSLLLPCFAAAANLPSVRIVMPEAVSLSPANSSLSPEIELANSGQTALTYRFIRNANRPIWAGRIVFKLVDETGNEVSPVYMPLHDYFSAEEASLGTEAPVRLRYGWPLSTKLGPGRYTLNGTTRVQDDQGEWHQIQCTPAAFVVKTESGAPPPDTTSELGTTNSH